ncbi:hypothetical protein X747_28945 [Mesorhizobium sp. LNJC384A00]|uniref:DUF4760 domain-containing protein n=1 Tax=Mesorhizobium sp. LNJC384A00 TaxID=1287268 RepID=UPI0003CF60C0|nr:DUF4760 domain-containing protein [Mesorhizobium sp. LNJC384A00]ESY35313.1 hypothetical protein X747_28945 [Mesorhizobium sp. LNJC384A00]
MNKWLFWVYAAIAGYTAFVSYHLYQSNFWHWLSTLPPADLATILYLPLVVGLLYLVNRFKKLLGLKGSEKSLIIFSCAALMFIAASAFLYDSTNKAPMAALLAGFFATCGWIYTSYEARENNKKAHTLNILLGMRHSDIFNRHRNILVDCFDKYDTVDYATIAAEQAKITDPAIDLKRSVRYVANYFEFMCVGYLTRDLDEGLLLKSMRSIMISFHDWFGPFLAEERLPQNRGNDRIFDNIPKAVAEFKRKLAKENR